VEQTGWAIIKAHVINEKFVQQMPTLNTGVGRSSENKEHNHE